MVPLYCFSMFPRPLHHLSEQQNAATTAALLARLAGSGVRPPHPLWGKLPLLPHSLPQLLGLPPFPPHHHPAHHHHQQHHHQNQFSPPPHQQHHSFLQGGFHSNSRGDGADSPIDGIYFSLLFLCNFFSPADSPFDGTYFSLLFLGNLSSFCFIFLLLFFSLFLHFIFSFANIQYSLYLFFISLLFTSYVFLLVQFFLYFEFIFPFHIFKLFLFF
jgi:hypothetical protein